MEKHCDKCKAANPKYAKYCGNCGARFADWKDTVVKPKIIYRGRPRYIYNILLLGSLIMLGLTIWYCYRVEDNNYNGNKYFSKIFGEKEFLKINGSDTIPAILFQAKDNGDFFHIQTNVNYHIEKLPKWCYISDSTANLFKIVPINNSSGKERIDTCYLVSKGKSIPIVLSQWGDCSAKFISLKVNYNSTKDNVSCIKFSIQFKTLNMLDNQGYCKLYFYNLNKEILLTPDPVYATDIGQLSSGKFFRPPYNDATYKELVIYIPKSVFYQAAPTGKALVKVSLYDIFNDNFIKLSESQLFKIDAEEPDELPRK